MDVRNHRLHAVLQVVAVSSTERRMYYASFDAAAQRWAVGTAASRDGFVWRKEGRIFSGGAGGSGFDGRGAAACHVTRDVATKQCAPPHPRAAACCRHAGVDAAACSLPSMCCPVSLTAWLCRARKSRWVMFYEAVAPDDRRSIGMAVSRDGRGGWRRLGRPVLEAAPAGSWDAGGVGAPSPVSMAGEC